MVNTHKAGAQASDTRWAGRFGGVAIGAPTGGRGIPMTVERARRHIFGVSHPFEGEPVLGGLRGARDDQTSHGEPHSLWVHPPVGAQAAEL